jgi:hypothetical protein
LAGLRDRNAWSHDSVYLIWRRWGLRIHGYGLAKETNIYMYTEQIFDKVIALPCISFFELINAL